MRRIVLALIFIYFNCYAQLPYLDSLKIQLKKANQDSVKCRILFLLIESEYDDKIWPIYNNKLKVITLDNLKKTSNPIFIKYLAETLNNDGYLANMHNESDKALNLYLQSLELQKKINNLNGIATIYNNIATVYLNIGNVQKALEYHNKSLKIYLELKDKVGIGRSYNNLGYIYDDLGNIQLALEYFHKSLNIRNQINDKIGVAACLNNIAKLYQKQGNNKKAKEYYHQSNKLQIEGNDIIGSLTSLNNINSILIQEAEEKEKEKLYDEAAVLLKTAENNYKKVLITQIEYEENIGISNTYSNLGSLYEILSKTKNNIKFKDSLTKEALNFFNLSLNINRKIENKNGVVDILNKIANLKFETGDLQTAKTNAEESFKIANTIGYPLLIKNSSEILSHIYSKQNDFRKAFEMQVVFKQMSDSVYNNANEKASIQTMVKYEYEKKSTADSVKVAEEKKVTNAQLKQEKTQRFALYGGILLIGLFGAFLYNRLKISKKQNLLIELQKSELQKQKEIVEEHQKETLDSIHYAKRIQNALIANSDFINSNISNNLIYFNPKDIVSGDFYWATKHNNKFYLAVCDSTGHGVPGAFMSLLNMGFLSEAIKEKNIEKPNEIFNYVRNRLISTISEGGQKDGMDGILICLEQNSRTIEYAAANNAPVLIKKNEIIELQKDRMPVGKGEKNLDFTLYTIELEKNDTLFLYTDGYADQFGGPKGKKFKYKSLNELLLNNVDLDLMSQKNEIEQTFISWKGNLEQVDDVLVIGVKI